MTSCLTRTDKVPLPMAEGAIPLRPATAEEAAAMPVFPAWGFNVISVLAERLFVKRLPLAGQGAGARGQRDSGKPLR